MSENTNHRQAVIDFHEARRKANRQEFFARLTGKSNRLLSFEEVRLKLKANEGNVQLIKEIPLDAIIGSVGRYTDFTRDFLPRRDSDRSRWTGVMEKTTGLAGLPPIDVYQVGEAYFVIDGNHRVSVARQLGASHIQAYVTVIRSRIPFSPDTQPDHLIIMAEQVNFLEGTQIDQLRPDVDLSVTIPGQYPILEEHISVHRYLMGVEEQREIPYEKAVAHWYDHVYLPVVNIIREHGILRSFPQRTETDLYLWIARHRADLEDHLGWQIGTTAVADDLVYTFAQNFNKTLSRLASRILDIVTPDPLETGPPVGHWRHKYVESRDKDCLFENILVALDKDPTQWYAFDQAAVIGKQEKSQLLGLHIIPKPEIRAEPYISSLKGQFAQRCLQEDISGELAVEVGGIARQIIQRSHWADIVVCNLAHPPGDKPIERLASGFRTLIRRCPRPILAVPGVVSDLNHALLAYSDSPKAEEALYIAAYMASKWGTHLTVLTIDTESGDASEVQGPAREYLEGKGIQADFIAHTSGPRAEIILNTAKDNPCDFILIGGYKSKPVVEVVLGSVVDQLLRGAKIPVLVCR
jgi:nucleotide-binding universal stress UspA family protein